MQTYLLTLKSYLLKGHERSRLAKKNILSNFVIKGMSILVILVLVPATISLVDSYAYGIWLTLSSVLSWVIYFDIGFGNGLKNKLTEALARGDRLQARKYISTTYFSLAVVVVLIALTGILVLPQIGWSRFLNVRPEYNHEIARLALFTLLSVCCQFVLQLISVIFAAHQETFVSGLVSLLSNAFILVLILGLHLAGVRQLLYVGMAYALSPLIVLCGFNLYFFRRRFSDLRPSPAYFRLAYARDILGLGLKFFVIQIAVIVQYELVSLLLSRHYGPDAVTTYNIVYRYFGVLSMLFAIIIAPFWSHFTDAIVKDDFAWIRNVMAKLLKVWVGLVLLGLAMLAMWKPVFDLWIGSKARFDFSLSCWVLAYFLTYTFGNIYTMFLNGSGKILVQLLSYSITPFLFLFLSGYLSKLLGPSGIVLAALLCNVYGIFLAPYQYYLLVNKKAKGVWCR